MHIRARSRTGVATEVHVRSRILISCASALLLASQAPARAEGRWSMGLLAGMSASQNHGSAVDGRLLAQANPRLGLGIETGLAYMNDVAISPPIYRTVSSDPGHALASVTDGITRNSAYYLGPAIKAGDALYAIASMGRYQFTNNDGHTTPT